MTNEETTTGFGRFFKRTNTNTPTSTLTVRCVKPADGLASLADQSVDVLLTTPHGATRPALLSLLDVAARKTRKFLICFWSVRDRPRPPVGWHEVAVHVWDRRDPRGDPCELITIWSREDGEPMPCLFFSASPPELARTWEVHPSSKPASILRQLLFMYSQAGDTIVDPFHGTGSVGRACERLGRTYIGFTTNRYFATTDEEPEGTSNAEEPVA